MASKLTMRQLCDAAIKEYGAETSSLRFLPENRYNRSLFPSTGQYDWFSGQLLYCLVRLLHPRRIIEISTASGYSTLFSAFGLKHNGSGMIDTFELDPVVAHAAQANFDQYGVSAFAKVHVGDARMIAPAFAGDDVDILILDSLHTQHFAEWFIRTFVTQAPRTALFQMHDIMPMHARVRCWGGPPFAGTPLEQRRPSLRTWLGGIVFSRTRDKLMSPTVYPPATPNGLATYAGNRTSEAVFGNHLVRSMSTDDYLFVFDIADAYPSMEARRYDSEVIGRANAEGQPFEWNESLWAFAGAWADAYLGYLQNR